jgi:hypothetical protein
MQFEGRIRSFPPHCIFDADETRVNATKGAKCITPRETSPFTVDLDHLTHISGICANNLVGTLFTPFFIIHLDSTAMHEFDKFIIAGKAWVCTTRNASHTRKSFFIRAIYFCHWLALCGATRQMITSTISD